MSADADTLDETPDLPGPDDAGALVVAGGVRTWLVPMPVKILQIITGYLLFRWVALLAGRHLLGLESECKLRFDGEHLVMFRRVRLLGRTVRESEETVLARDVLTVGLERRFPHLLLLTGALGLLIGAIVGVGWVIDGIQASYIPIAVFGLAVLALGVGFDIALGSLADHLGPRAGLLLTLRTTRGFQLVASRFRIEGVDEKSARALIRAFLT